MSPGDFLTQSEGYKVATPIYEGPLDLLLQLIERAELDITKLALAQVTDQYLEYLKQIEDHVVSEISAFLVIAAKLLQIKSEALLPRPLVREPGEEDPGEELARQLLVYKRFRQIADLLMLREEAGLHTYLRLAPPPNVEGTVDLTGISVSDLAIAAQSVFSQAKIKAPLSTVVTAPRITIREKLTIISQLLRQRKHLSFWELVSFRQSRLHIIVTFLALLELIRRHLVSASQENNFGEITLQVSDVWDEDEEFELEFGE